METILKMAVCYFAVSPNESCVSTGVRKPGNTSVSPTAMI